MSAQKRLVRLLPHQCATFYNCFLYFRRWRNFDAAPPCLSALARRSTKLSLSLSLADRLPHTHFRKGPLSARDVTLTHWKKSRWNTEWHWNFLDVSFSLFFANRQTLVCVLFCCGFIFQTQNRWNFTGNKCIHSFQIILSLSACEIGKPYIFSDVKTVPAVLSTEIFPQHLIGNTFFSVSC